MNKKVIRNSLLLVLTAFIWGVAFVAQVSGGSAVGPFAFNCIRMLIGAAALLPVIPLLDKWNPNGRKPRTCEERKRLWVGGFWCGVSLFFASILQQLGITLGTPAGKAGFLTACYILLVPLFGLLLKKHCDWNVWIGVLLALGGLYLLCINGKFALQMKDALILLSAVCFAVQILIIDHYSPLVDGVRMACIQFLTCGLLGVVPMVLFDIRPFSGEMNIWLNSMCSIQAWIPILYAGILSSGVAYTLQIVAQDGLNPTVASLIMSLESVFSVLAGWILLKQILSLRERMGCFLLFFAIVLAQIPMKIGKKK